LFAHACLASGPRITLQAEARRIPRRLKVRIGASMIDRTEMKRIREMKLTELKRTERTKLVKRIPRKLENRLQSGTIPRPRIGSRARGRG
ncbi:hypothetical protein CLOM_g10657, partial [Closterium sp. NIES-68]